MTKPDDQCERCGINRDVHDLAPRPDHSESAEIERLKGELAEAKRLIARYRKTPASEVLRDDADRFLAVPPPAESTPVPMRCTASAGSCNSPKACREAGRCIDARMREVVGAAESTPVKCQRLHCGHGEDKHPSAGHTSWACTVQGCRCNSFLPPPATQPAPPDDIRARVEDSLINRIAEAKAYVLGRLESHVHCRACGFILRPENALVADGCPCNSGRGVNHGLVARNTCTCAVCDQAQTGGARKPSALEAKGEPGTHATTSQEQEGRCQGMVADRQCTQRNGHGGGCHHMYTEAAVWIAPTKEHRFVPQRRHRGIPIDLCDECAYAESHPCHPKGAKT